MKIEQIFKYQTFFLAFFNDFEPFLAFQKKDISLDDLIKEVAEVKNIFALVNKK